MARGCGVYSRSMRVFAALAVAVVLAAGCSDPPPRAPALGADDQLSGAFDGEFSLPGVRDRAYRVHLPPSYDPATPIPVVVALHGGGSNSLGALLLTCKSGKLDDDSCLTSLADREGFAVIAPDGFPNPIFTDRRTWNAGGDGVELQCVSGEACANASDDLAFFDTLHEELLRAINVDTARVYATGMSNGAAMAHRLGCERSDRFAALAPVGGGNQFAAWKTCTVSRPVSVLGIHGGEDPCWAFEGGATGCAQEDGKLKVSIPDTMDGWAERGGCTGEVVTTTFDDEDGLETTLEDHTGCLDGAEVQLMFTPGAGHTWPGGYQYLDANRVGRTEQDVSANDEMWRFFQRHVLVQ